MKYLKWFLPLAAATLLFTVFTFSASAAQKGDVDGDGQITAGDARLTLRLAVGLDYCDDESDTFHTADINADHMITAADARLILRTAVELEYHPDDTIFLALTDDYSIQFENFYWDEDGIWYTLLIDNKTDMELEVLFFDDNANGFVFNQYLSSVTLDPYEISYVDYYIITDDAPAGYEGTPFSYVVIDYMVFGRSLYSDDSSYLGEDVIFVYSGDYNGSYYPPYDESAYFYADPDFRIMLYNSSVTYNEDFDTFQLRLMARNDSGQNLHFSIYVTDINGIEISDDQFDTGMYYSIYSNNSGYLDYPLEYYYNHDYESILNNYGIQPDEIDSFGFQLNVYDDDWNLIYSDNWLLQ